MELFFLFNFLASLLSASPTPSIETRLKIKEAALRSFLDPLLVESIVEIESNFKTKALSNKGAMGLMQVMPSFADSCDIHEPYHALNNLMGACECLRKLINRYQGNIELALAAYNAGVKNVTRYGGIPPFKETKSYVSKILISYKKKQLNK